MLQDDILQLHTKHCKTHEHWNKLLDRGGKKHKTYLCDDMFLKFMAKPAP